MIEWPQIGKCLVTVASVASWNDLCNGPVLLSRASHPFTSLPSSTQLCTRPSFKPHCSASLWMAVCWREGLAVVRRVRAVVKRVFVSCVTCRQSPSDINGPKAWWPEGGVGKEMGLPKNTNDKVVLFTLTGVYCNRINVSVILRFHKRTHLYFLDCTACKRAVFTMAAVESVWGLHGSLAHSANLLAS